MGCLGICWDFDGPFLVNLLGDVRWFFAPFWSCFGRLFRGCLEGFVELGFVQIRVVR